MSRMKAAGLFLAIVTSYLLTGWLGLYLAVPPGFATAIWIPSGIAFVAVLILGYRYSFAVFLGSFLINLFIGAEGDYTSLSLLSIFVAAGIGVGATLQAIVGTYLIKNKVGFPNHLCDISIILRFALLSGPLAALVNTSWSNCFLLLIGILDYGDFAINWFTWWVGDTMGLLIVTPILFSLFASPRALWRKRIYTVSLPLIVLFMVIVAVFMVTRNTEHEKMRLGFDAHAEQLSDGLEKNINDTINALIALDSFYAASSEVTRNEFKLFVTPLLEEHSSIQALSWAKLVSDKDRESFEKQARKQGFIDFHILDQVNGKLEIATQKNFYTPIWYVEPLSKNKEALGFNIMSEPQRGNAILKSWHNNQMTATDAINLVQENSPVGILLITPTHDTNNNLPGPQIISGFVTSVIIVDELINTITTDNVVSLISFKLEDITEHKTTLYKTPAVDSPMFKWEQQIKVADKIWQFSVIAGHRYLLANYSWYVWGMLASGLLFVSFISVFLLVLSGQQATIENKVRKRTSQLNYMAKYDLLTGLPNRNLFLDTLNEKLKKAENIHQEIALFFMDLDNLKKINDTLGHTLGDELLKIFAKRLRKKIKMSDFVARLGGDEFIMLYEYNELNASIEDIAKRIISVCDRSFYIGGSKLKISVSIGIAVYPHAGTIAEDLVKHADIAMYKAKESEGSSYAIFTPELKEQVGRQNLIEDELERALIENETKLYYQPIMDAKHNKIVAIETLIRWIHPSLNYISPDEFVKTAEQSQLIFRLGNWVVDKVCKDVSRWQKLYPKITNDIKISINFSALQFLQADLVASLIIKIAEYNLKPEQFIIEITETALMENIEQVRSSIDDLNTAGFFVAIDDFGTGYSSLSYLKTLPVKYIKIDQSFIHDMLTDKEDLALVEAILNIANSRRLVVIAEGVETKEQAQALIELGCYYLQGYYFNRPMKIEDIDKLFADNNL